MARAPADAPRPALMLAVGVALAALGAVASPLPEGSPRPVLLFLAAVALVATIPATVVAAPTPRRRRRRFACWLLAHLAAGTLALGLLAFAPLLLPGDRRLAPPNELAGVALLLLPPAVLAAMAPRRALSPGLRAAGAVAALTLATVLLASGSRGGLLVAAVTLPASLALDGRRSRGWAMAAAGALLVGLLVVLLFAPVTVGRFLTDGTPQGLEPRVLLSGRPEIWRRALFAIADFPILGLGLGSFGEAAAVLYPPRDGAPGAVEDAHQLALQTTLDLGLPGLLAVLALLVVAVRRALGAWRRGRPGGTLRAVAAGLLGGLGAHLAWSLGDVVALGTSGSLALAGTLGLCLALPAATSWTPGRARRPPPAWTLGVLALALLVAGLLLPHQLASSAAARRVLATRVPLDPGSAPAPADLAGLPRSPACRGHWLRGLAAHAAGDVASYRREWSALVACAPRHLPMVAATAPDDALLARRARALRPDRAEPHLWLARHAERHGQRAAALDHYAAALERSPGDGRAWLAYGRLLLAAGRVTAAGDAFLAACHRGDPGANGCWLAGRTAEAAGDVERAVGAYRLSRWEVARRRAAELEAAAATGALR